MTETETDLASCCTHGDLEWHGCYGSGAKYNRYTIPESVKHPAKISFELLERIFKHMESMELLNHDSVIIDFMAGTGRTGTMASLHGYKTISVELEPHFIEMIAGYDCDGISISDFLIKPCVCKSGSLHKPHKIKTGLFESHKQETLEGDTKDVHKGRISFFKRLSLEKGTTVAMWEDVLFARIPR